MKRHGWSAGVWTFAGLAALALGAAACSDKSAAGVGSSGHGGASAAGAGGASSSGSGGASGASGGSDGGATGAAGAVTGTGGALAGSAGTGGTSAGTGGIGGTTAGTGGGAGDAGDGGVDGPQAAGPARLIIFYTRWGTSYPEWWPKGTQRDFTFNPMLDPLTPFKSELIVLSALTNTNLGSGASPAATAANANVDNDAMMTLLTARPAAVGRRAQGPSLDTVVGDCGGAAGPPLRLAVGKFLQDHPGVSYAADGTGLPGERDPNAVAQRLLGHTVDAPAPDADLATNYPAFGAAHIKVMVEALATKKTCAATLMWGDDVAPAWLSGNPGGGIHDRSHGAPGLYLEVTSTTPPAMTGNAFAILQRWYAEQFASLLAQLRAVPVEGGTLLDQSVVLWISESGAGSDHLGWFIPVIIAGKGAGHLDTGRFIEIKPRPLAADDVTTVWRTQGDLLAALASIWNITGFGDPAIARQPLTFLLR